MCKKMLFAAAIVLILGGVCWASTSDMIPTFPSPYPFTSFSDTDTTALWLFDEANYKNTTLTDASPYEMSDLVLMTTGNTSYKGTLVTGKWGSALNVPGGTSTFAVSYAEFKGSVCKDHLDDNDGAVSGVWGPTESPAALLNGLDSGVGTVEFWINLPSLPGSDVPVLQIGFAYSPGWTLDLKSSGTVFEINNAYYGKKAVCPTSLSTNQWVHVAFTQNGSTFRHFVNGTEKTTPTVSTITEQALPALQVPTQRDHDHRDFGPMSSDTRRQNRFNISVGHNRQGTSAMTAKFDEVRISKVVRYSGNFTAPGSFSRAYGANPPARSVATKPALLFETTPSTPVQLGTRKYMFIDQAIVDSSSNVTITCNPPTNGQTLGYTPTVASERPSYFDVDGTVYMTNPLSYGDHLGVTYLLTSNDGINWSQPNCGTWGSNNIALYGNPMYSESFVDTNPYISSEEKYKLTGASSNRGIYMYFSPDGINWRRNEVAMLPIMVESGAETFFDDQMGTYYNVLKRDGSYNTSSCTSTGRRGVVFEGDEYFKAWPFDVPSDIYWEGWTIPCLTCEGPIIFAPNSNGEVYRARAIKYPWAPDVYLAFIWRFPTDTCRQVDLGVSRDGLNWTYFASQTWYMGKGSYGEALSSYGLVRRNAGHQYNVTAKDEIWQYFEFGGCHDGEPRTRKRYVQRLDGFTSLDAGGTSATVVTKPLVFHGNQLALNVKATGTVKVALLNDAQQELSGYGLANCDTITADSTERVVTWGGNSNVSSLDGTVVRVKFVMTNAKLYAMQFIGAASEPPVVHWKFDEGSGSTASDATGHGNTGTLYNGPTWVAGRFGNALSFDGSNDYVYRSSLSTPVTGDASISLWLNYTNANTALRALNLGGWQVRFSGGCVGWDNSGGPSSETYSTNAYNNGQWHHVVFTRSSTNYKMYIDSVADKTGTGTAPDYTSLYVGATSSSSQFYIGKVDDVRIYDYALTQSEITSLYQGGTPDTTPPTPNPATFASAPAAISSSAISMTATTGSDSTGPVQYYFDETSGNPGGTDSGWQTSASYTDSGLNASTQYTYTVQMRDSAATPNVGTASTPASATTWTPDTTPPTPNPATFASAPAAISSSAISMTATTGSDSTGPVQYYFDETSGNPGGTDSGWQTSASYTDSGLNASTQYTYTVQMRDSAATPNVGTASSPASATTQSVTVNPPFMQWKFDEGSGLMASDSIGNGNTGMMYNWPSWVTGKFGNAVSFDGQNDYIYRSSLSTTVSGDGSISLWLNYTDANTGKRALNLGGWQVRFSGGCVGWDNSGGPSSETYSTNAYNNGQWHHVVFTRSGTTYKMYIDGAADKTGSGTVVSYSWLYAGAQDAATNFYIGQIDDVRIFNYALSSAQVSAVYTQTPTADITLLEDGFEVNFDKWTDGGATDWDRDSSSEHWGSYCAEGDSAENDLISDNLNTTGKSRITINFWYRDTGIDDDDDAYLQLYNGSSYVNKFEVGTVSPENTWNHYTVTIWNSGGDAQYFRSDFRIKFEGTSLDTGEYLRIDDVLITTN